MSAGNANIATMRISRSFIGPFANNNPTAERIAKTMQMIAVFLKIMPQP
jgi:hypothetical protein